jgi:ribosomal protein S1
MNLSAFSKAVETHGVLPVSFAAIDYENELLWLEDGDEDERYRIELPLSDFFGNYTKERRRDYHLESLLTHDIVVVVVSVDEEKKLVRVSNSEARKILRSKERLEMQNKLTSEGKVTVMGRVVAFKGQGHSSHAVIRPLNSELRLMLPVAWVSLEFVNDIRDALNLKELVEVQVFNKSKTGFTRSSSYDFICSRKALFDDPWANVASKLHRDDIVTVTVTGTQKIDGDNLPDFGKSVGLPCIIDGINVNAYVRTKSNLQLKQGFKYLSVVDYVDPSRRRVGLTAFRLKPDSKLQKK